MLAYRTNGNELLIKQLLRHKQITNTIKYIPTINLQHEDDLKQPKHLRQKKLKLLAKADE